MNKEYKIKLDLNKKLYNKKMAFNQFDENVNDFYIEVTKNNEVVKDLDKSIITLVAIKPNNAVDAQFIEVKEGQIYADLKPSMCDLVGNYQAKAMIVLEGEIVTTDTINYSVSEDKIISRLNDDVVSDERFPLFTDALARLSTIEISEEQRVINEAERILSEENRKIEEAKRVEAELIRQHEEADRTKYDATRESNENIRKINESIRLANETNRIDEETKRVEEENKRKLAEEERNANYNFMTEDEERRRSEANAHKEAEKLRVQAETNRVNEEAKRRTTEQVRVSAENTRVSNENTRKANETTRQTNETHRVEAETQRQNRYNSFIADAEANASNFENYTNTAKVKEEERKSNELDRKSQETKRVSNEVERISNENTRKANEKAREKNETSRQYVFENKVNEVDKKIIEINTTKDNFVSSVNTKVDTKISELDNAKSDMTNTVSNKVNEVETRFNALTSSQQQDAEVIDARDGETSLKARLDRDIEKAKQVYVNVEGSHISTDSSSGYLKDIEILGNTIQNASNLANIRSVGDKVEGQELYEIPVLSRGKNLINEASIILGESVTPSNGQFVTDATRKRTDYIKFNSNTNYIMTNAGCILFYDANKQYIGYNNSTFNGVSPSNCAYIVIRMSIDATNIQLEEGTVATEYEPYVEDKLTILSPTPLEKVGDVADRLIEKDGVWGVEKNFKTIILNGTENYVLTNTYTNTLRFKIDIPDKKISSRNIITDRLTYTADNDTEGWNDDSKYALIYFFINKSKLSTQDVEGFKQWLQANNILVKYQLLEPQFIPLPHDQQIKLRTFANKTNISFLTEIEGTIKAQVPKSLGSSINTHTEQINNLNKELDRVKKLEESTVSTVTTESDFTTVEATSNGYFEDVKLEGKTLVNLATQPTNNGAINNQYATISTVTNIKPSTEYTYIIRNNGSETLKLYLNTNGGFDWFDLDVEANSTVIGKAKTLPTISGDIWLSLSKAETIEQNLQVVLLEGDHTQNSPSFFEGLMSVAEDTDEIVVESVKGDGNLFDGTMEVGSISADGKLLEWSPFVRTDYINVKPGVSVFCKVVEYDGITPNIQYSQRLCEYDINKNFIKSTAENKNVVVLSDKTKYIRYSEKIESNDMDRVDLSKVNKLLVCYASSETDYTPYQSDKKRLLYYNEETQTWEKPILREWDSIEKHANGKYYYHVRSKEGDYVEGDESLNDCITDLTVSVKKLAEEKVYECTNIDLITYANETNFIVESGVLSPKTTLKVHNNISNVVSLLQKKVSLLESNVKASQEVQDMMILETDMRMLDIELALMDFMPMQLNLGGSDMLRSATYFNFLKNHIINETYEKEYLENVMNKYLATKRINQDEYNELYKMLYPPVYDIELPIEY